jgi:hypothetical protein
LYNIEHQILPSANTVIDRLLARQIELTDTYAELCGKLHAWPLGLEVIIDAILRVAPFWNPERVAASRDDRSRLDVVNSKIAKASMELADLLDERERFHNHSSFYSMTHYHIAEMIEEASFGNGYFRSHLKDKLHLLRGQFDLKYWPGIADVVRVLSRDAREAAVDTANPITRAATTGLRGSRADFFKGLLAAIDDEISSCPRRLPMDFKLSDNALASLANCALDLGADDLVDSAYVKRLRQRERGRTAPSQG